MLNLAIRKHPDVSSNAGVIEKVQWQSDDSFQPVVFDEPAANIAFPLAGVSGEQ